MDSFSTSWRPSIQRNFSIFPPLSWAIRTPDTLFEVLRSSVEYMIEVIHEIESQLQLGIRNRVMGVVVRTRDEAGADGPTLKKPCCILWDSHAFGTVSTCQPKEPLSPLPTRPS